MPDDGGGREGLAVEGVVKGFGDAGEGGGGALGR